MENEDLITQYIQNVLQREPMDGEVDAYVALVDSGNSTLEDVQMNIINSAEAVDNVYPIVLTYQAIYGRVPDADGLNYWTDVYKANMDLDNPDTATVDEAMVEVLKTFVDADQTPEFATNYGVDPTGDQFVAAAYTNVLNRAPDEAGLNYWQDRYAQIEASYAGSGMSEAEVDVAVRAQILEQFVGSAEYETETSEEVDGYLAMLADGEAIDTGMSLYDVETPDEEGEAFTFTTDLGENFEGTEDADTVNAVADAGGVAAGATFNPTDSIDGMGGDDTLNLLATSALAPVPGTIENVEHINFVSDVAADGFNALDAGDYAGVEQMWQVNAAAAADVTGVTNDVTVGYEGSAVGNIGAAAGTTDVNVALDNATAGGTINVEETAAGDVTTFSATGSVGGAGGLTIDLDTGFGGSAPSAEETVNLAITSDGTITITSATATTVDAADSTGDLTIGAPAAVETLSGGAGSDALTGGAASQLIEGNDGDDVINAGNTAAGEVIIGGAGADDITLGAGGVAQDVVVNEGDSSLALATIDEVTNFITTEDHLDFNLSDGSATNFVDGGASSSFVDAQTNANTAFGSDDALQYFVSDDGTDGWVFVNADGDGAADFAVQLTGLVANGGIVAGDFIA